MNKFAALNLTKRANAKADAEGLFGVHRELFVFVATNGEQHFNSLMRRFSMHTIETWVGAMADLMNRNLIFQMHSSSLYYAVAI